MGILPPFAPGPMLPLRGAGLGAPPGADMAISSAKTLVPICWPKYNHGKKASRGVEYRRSRPAMEFDTVEVGAAAESALSGITRDRGSKQAEKKKMELEPPELWRSSFLSLDTSGQLFRIIDQLCRRNLAVQSFNIPHNGGRTTSPANLHLRGPNSPTQ